MKFYIASSFDLVNRVRQIAIHLKAKGHEITVEWWHKDYKRLLIAEEEWYQNREVINISKRNFKGIEDADIFLLIAPKYSPKSFNGANIELGYALALGKPCYSIGKLQRSAMYVPIRKFQKLAEVLNVC